MQESSLPASLFHIKVPRSDSERVLTYMQKDIVLEEERAVTKLYEIHTTNTGTLIHTQTNHYGLTIDENRLTLKEDQIICNYLHLFDAEGGFVNAYFESDNMLLPPSRLIPSLFVRLLTYPTQLFSGREVRTSNVIENYANGHTYLFCNNKTAKKTASVPMYNLKIFLEYEKNAGKIVMTTQANLGIERIIGKTITMQAEYKPFDDHLPELEWSIKYNQEITNLTFYGRWMREKLLFEERRAHYEAEFLM